MKEEEGTFEPTLTKEIPQLSLVTYNEMNADGTKVVARRMRWMSKEGTWVSEPFAEFVDAQQFLTDYHKQHAERLSS